ncbi:MAG: InlB B-repeat-containing protein, partial [Treponema sp.]|nr:InlB B-repeat-containing protein [Treponema sp.]
MKKKVLSLIALGALTLLWSCSNGFEERVGQVHSSDGKTYLVIDSASVASRSVNPGESDTDTSKLTDFVLKGTPENGSETELATTNSLVELKEKQIEIITGNWSFTLTAKLYGIDFSGTTTAEIKVGEINTISFELKSVQTYGGINITVVFDADPNLTEVVATLKNPDKSSITGIEPITVEKADFTEIKDDNDVVTGYSVVYSRLASDENERLASGSYYLVFDFYAEGTTDPINSIPYVVNIADGITTTYSQTVKLNETYTITYFLDGSELESAETRPEKYSRKSEAVTLPTMSKEDYAFAGWYTDNEFTSPITEIPTGSTGNIKLYACFINSIIVNAEGTADANVAAGEAVDSITTALGKIQSYATVIDWTILIDGKVEGTTTLGLQDMYATSLTIMGAHKNTDENYTDILDGGSVFAETQAGATIKGSIFTIYNSCVPITIKNLKITHGNSSRGYGGAFDTNGTVTLDDGTWITDNHTYYDGGAIMNTDNATLTIKAGVRIDNNSASDSGGAIRNAGTLIIEGGEIMDNTSGRAVIQQEGTMIIKGSPIFGEGQNIGLAAYYPFTAYWVTVDGELDSNIPVITIAPGSFTDYKGKV